jgi:hypothetical protein
VLPDLGYQFRAPAAVGRVRGWGRVVLHREGWRAQYVQVEMLFVAAGDRPEFTDELSAWYEVPVLEVSDVTSSDEMIGVLS